jgi:hypothetical protein
MYECIKTVYNGDSWLARLPKDQQDRVERFWTRQHDENSDVDKLLVTSLGHKATIIEATPSLSPISTSFSGFKPIVDLRDQLAHAKDYAGTPSTARVTCQIVRRIEELVQQLSDRLKKKASP